MDYKDIDDGELFMLVCEDDENAKEVLFNKYKFIIDLTIKTMEINIANMIYDRHVTLTKLLESIGVNKATAEADACKMEHVISDETMQAIKKHFNK